MDHFIKEEVDIDNVRLSVTGEPGLAYIKQA